MKTLSTAVFLVALALPLGCAATNNSKELGAQALQHGEFAKAYRLWLPIAQGGDSETQEAIAILLAGDEDLGIRMTRAERDKQSVDWTKRSALSGNRQAMKWISDAFRFGWLGVGKDPDAAACWKRASRSSAKPQDCKLPIVLN